MTKIQKEDIHTFRINYGYAYTPTEELRCKMLTRHRPSITEKFINKISVISDRLTILCLLILFSISITVTLHPVMFIEMIAAFLE